MDRVVNIILIRQTEAAIFNLRQGLRADAKMAFALRFRVRENVGRVLVDLRHLEEAGCFSSISIYRRRRGPES